MQNGRKIQNVELSEATDWQHSFQNLPEFDEKGKAYNYTIKDKIPEELKTGPVRIATKKDRLLDQTEVSRIAVPVIGGVILLLSLLVGRKRKN